VAAGLQLYEWTKSAKRPWVDSIMLPLPLFHVYANVGVQPLAFIGPNPLSLVPNPRDIDDLLKTIREVKPAFFNGVPTLYTAILNHKDVRAGKVDLSSIKLCFSGSAALMAETKREFERVTGARIVEGYSLTEGMMACCVNPVQGTNKLGSIGVPLPDVEVRIVDADVPEREMGVDEVGEMLLRAPQHMVEYWNNRSETVATLKTYGPGGPWVHTGDLARMDADGFIFIVDRKKDMLKTSGFQVWPREIEEVLATHPAVMEVGVAGVPDSAKGEVAHGLGRTQARPTGHLGSAACVLPRASGAVQSAGARRIQIRTAEDDGGKGATACARRGSAAGIGTSLQISRPRAPRVFSTQAPRLPGVSPCTQIVSTSGRAARPVTRASTCSGS
jgi:long-chain acyl-CoA synthetase